MLVSNSAIPNASNATFSNVNNGVSASADAISSGFARTPKRKRAASQQVQSANDGDDESYNKDDVEVKTDNGKKLGRKCARFSESSRKKPHYDPVVYWKSLGI